MPSNVTITIGGQVDKSLSQSVDSAIYGLQGLGRAVGQVNELANRLGRLLGDNVGYAAAGAVTAYTLINRYTQARLGASPAAVLQANMVGDALRDLAYQSRAFGLGLMRASPYIAAAAAGLAFVAQAGKLARAREEETASLQSQFKQEDALAEALRRRIALEEETGRMTKEVADQLRYAIVQTFAQPDRMAGLVGISGQLRSDYGRLSEREMGEVKAGISVGEAAAKYTYGRDGDLDAYITRRQQLLEEARLSELAAEGLKIEDLTKIRAEFTAKSIELDTWADEQRKNQNEQRIQDEAEMSRRIVAIHQQEQERKVQSQNFMFGATSNMLGSMANLAAVYGKKGFAAWKGLQVAQAIISTYQAVTGALASQSSIPGVGPVMAKVAAGMALVAGMANVATIMATQPPSYAVGGYTGAGGMFEPAGIVHRGEFVMPAPAVDRLGLPALEAMRSGQGGFTFVVVKDYNEAQDYLNTVQGQAQIISLVGSQRHRFA